MKSEPVKNYSVMFFLNWIQHAKFQAFLQTKKALKIVQRLWVTPHFNDCFLLQKLRFGGRQSNVSMTITVSRVTGTAISIVNSQSIRVALSSLLDSSINRNWEVRLIKSLEAPFRLSRSQPAMFWSCKFTNNHNNMRQN